MALYVALCGAIQNARKLHFSCFSRFWVKLGKKAVALCGAMWRYPKKLENCIFPGFLVFGQNLEKRLWHYVALCGAIPKSLKIACFPGFLVFWQNLEKKAVALFGAMWRYPKKLENCIFPGFLVFG